MKNLNAILDGLSIITPNLYKMIDFYNTVFNVNLQPVAIGNMTIYEGALGKVDITLTPSQAFGTASYKTLYQLRVLVSDLTEAILLTKAAGGTQLQDIHYFDEGRFCGVADPDGNTIELREKDERVDYG